MLRRLASALLSLIASAQAAMAHPPRGIVVDARGNVYFSDLERIWMVDPRGRLTLARPGVPGRHIHELVIDASGSVHGEENTYDPAREQWPSAIWKMELNRRATYLVPTTTAPLLGTGLWRDARGCTYLAQQDRAPAGPLLFRRCRGRGAELLFGKPDDARNYRQVLLSNMGGTAMGPEATSISATAGQCANARPTAGSWSSPRVCRSKISVSR